MNSLISRILDEAAAGYETGQATVRVSLRPPGVGAPPVTPDIISTGQLRMPPPLPGSGKVRRANKPRFEVDLQVDSESNLYAGFTDEPVGVFVATHTRLAVGSVVDLEVALPDGRNFTTTGRVQWVQEPRDPSDTETVPGLGIEFTHVAARPDWTPPVPEVITPSMPPISIMSIHPLRPDDAGALVNFGQVRTPTFFDE